MMILEDLILNNPDITVAEAWRKARDMENKVNEMLSDFWLYYGPNKRLTDVISVDRAKKNG